MVYHAKNVIRILLVKFQLNSSILKILTFEPLYDPLMTFYYIAFVLTYLKCHTYTFSQVSAQLEHFENFDFRTPLCHKV